jgi:hypothetical protein
MNRRPGRIEFMSTQRREIRSTPATKTRRRGVRCRWQHISCMNRAGADGRSSLAPVARYGYLRAIGLTAHPERFHPVDNELSPGTPARSATDSLQKDQRKVRFLRHIVRHGYPPLGSRSAQPGFPSHGSSLSPISILPGSARLHLTLPQAPAGDRRWAERYDGKRDLHFFYAA